MRVVRVKSWFSIAKVLVFLRSELKYDREEFETY